MELSKVTLVYAYGDIYIYICNTSLGNHWAGDILTESPLVEHDLSLSLSVFLSNSISMVNS